MLKMLNFKDLVVHFYWSLVVNRVLLTNIISKWGAELRNSIFSKCEILQEMQKTVYQLLVFVFLFWFYLDKVLELINVHISGLYILLVKPNREELSEVENDGCVPAMVLL